MRLIDADKLKKAIMLKDDVAYETWNELYDSVLEEIDNAPTVPLPDFKDGYKQAILDGKAQYQSPPGKWIYKCCYGDEFPQCSVCGEINDVKTNFCPDCGADMRGKR